MIIPFNNVACSLYPSTIIVPHDGSSSSSSETLDTVLQSPEMLSPSDDGTAPSLHTNIYVPDDSDSLTYTTQPHFVSSPTADTRRPHPGHRLRGYRSGSTESTDIGDVLGSGEISRLTRDDMTLVARSSQLSFDLSTEVSHEGTTMSSLTCQYGEDQGTPVLSPNDIYPIAPELFSRYEKRRKMLESNPFCPSSFLTLLV